MNCARCVLDILYFTRFCVVGWVDCSHMGKFWRPHRCSASSVGGCQGEGQHQERCECIMMIDRLFVLIRQFVG